MRGRILVFIFIGLLALSGCNQTHQSVGKTKPTSNPTAMDILADNPDADIFQLQGIIYKNAKDIDWVQSEELSIGEKVGTIAKQYKEGMAFEDGMATKLPVGAEIYEPAEKVGPILLVRLGPNERVMRYLGLIEG